MSTLLKRTPLYLVQTIHGVPLRVTVVIYSLLVSERNLLVAKMGCGRLCYHHANVNTNFTAVYRNYTSRTILDVCINVNIHSFPNLPIFTTMFDGVTCTGLNSRNTISEHLHVSDRLESCLNGTEIHKVTTPGSGKFEQYCAAQQTGCCSSTEFSSTVENAFISCPTNTSCNAECYRGFIFPTGQTNELFSCQKDVWTPMLSACKAIPEVSVTYSTIWNFTDIIPYFCGNISTHLNTSTPILEETFVNQCQNLIIHRSVKIAFSTLAFTVSFSVYFSAQFLVGHKKDGILNHNY